MTIDELGWRELGRGARALAIGAHPDDVEWGCFGTLQRFAERAVVVLTSGEAGGPADTRRREAEEAAAAVGAKLEVHQLVDTRLDVRDAIEVIDDAVTRFRPHFVFTMSENDVHQDHATLGRASTVALRTFDGIALSYPTPSLPPARFSPQVFMAIDEDRFATKLAALSCHRTQGHRYYLTREHIETTARYWALTAGARARWCEPFELRRWTEPPSERPER